MFFFEMKQDKRLINNKNLITYQPKDRDNGQQPIRHKWLRLLEIDKYWRLWLHAI